MRWWGSIASFLFVAWLPNAGLGAQSCADLVAAAEALGARTGVAVCDDAGRVWYGHRIGEPFAPASNQKLLTAAAVLSGLGAEHRFTTRFWLRGGRLVVEASGDPNWIHDSEHAPERVFAVVAVALQRAGVTAVAGIDLDAGTFTGPTRPAGWPRDQHYTYYCAPTGPFVLEQGTFVLAIDADAGATAAHIGLVAPPAGLPVEGSIAVVDRAKGAVYGAVDLGSAIQVRGKFHRKSPPVTIRTAMQDPTGWYLATLRQVLTSAGVRVDAGAAAAVPDRLVHEYASPLRPALQRMLEDSSNFDAEQCLRVLGAKLVGDGSLAGGLAALRRQLQAQLGTVPDGVVLTDGSGLSSDNRITPGVVAAALLTTSAAPGGGMLFECLPVAGRSGTLADRFVGSPLVGRVRAKTGWIRGASALSGVVDGADGARRWFAILMNYDPARGGLNKELKALQERLVAAIAALAAPGPQR
ncbi:MAG: D-alanyl-D-alanine carboxypeptidase/D-alanyl-D-alanine-endopeptidase [Planctomycetes bacterium]|nr:D-alanyl-D-alanine carboxypeptidase/D-alanyl-D-alanine-endopeptidase [Planctomycetota bacterium]